MSRFIICLVCLFLLIPSAYGSSKYTQVEKDNAIEGLLDRKWRHRLITRKYVTRLVEEAIEVLSKEENSWLPLHDLLGLAMNESDLHWWIETGPKSSADCGITQNHIPLFAKTYWERRALCERLKKSTKLSFEYAMKELNIIKRRWCTSSRVKSNKPEDMYRCIFNVYNQGPRYILGNPVKNAHRNRYWLRNKCFATSVLLGRGPKIDCRRALTLDWINQVFQR